MQLKNRFQKIQNSIGLIDLILLFWLSCMVHFWRISYPNSIVFDEVTFGKFLNAYAKGEYYFDLHPPLGKLLFYAVASIGRINTGFSYDKIGTIYTDSTYVWLRSLTALGGTVIPIFSALVLRGLGFSRWVAVIAALLIIFENALIVISRTFIFDVFILTFGFASLAFGIWFHRTHKKYLGWISWILGAAAFSIKWTGLSFLGVLTLWELHSAFKTKKYWNSSRRLFFGWMSAFSFYFIIFLIHFKFTPYSGMGNDFMSAEFQSGLKGNQYYAKLNIKSLNYFEKFLELNKMMLAYQKTMNQGHPYSSSWYSWPFLVRPIYFWGNTESLLKERIYLLGNPILWWSVSLSLIFFILANLRNAKAWISEEISGSKSREFCLLILFTINFIPFIFIGRIMFIYHYLVALVVGLMILAVGLEKIALLRPRLVWIFLGICFISFYYFSPLTYALPLSDLEYEYRLWLPSWL